MKDIYEDKFKAGLKDESSQSPEKKMANMNQDIKKRMEHLSSKPSKVSPV